MNLKHTRAHAHVNTHIYHFVCAWCVLCGSYPWGKALVEGQLSLVVIAGKSVHVHVRVVYIHMCVRRVFGEEKREGGHTLKFLCGR